MQGYVNEIALDLVAADGEKIPTIANAAEKRDADGAHLFTRLTLFKAVDRRNYERSLVDARTEAEIEARAQRDAAVVREQFIAVLGHDLRNPMAAIAAGDPPASQARAARAAGPARPDRRWRTASAARPD